MPSIELIKASDGSGNANVATVQNSRSPGASTIIVDTVVGINPAGFAGTMGTPHTFTDPITSETITVISEATAVDFTGHVDGSNLEIDDIAPGYLDTNGSEVGDIVIIRPTTQWSDNLAETLEVAHDDDGSLKAGAVDNAGVLASNVVTTAKILDSNVTTPKIANDAVTMAKISNDHMWFVYRNAALNSAGVGFAIIPYDTERYDYANLHSGGRVTATIAGNYHCSASQLMNTTDNFRLYFYKNGVAFMAGTSANGTGPVTSGSTVTGDIPLAIGDYIEVFDFYNAAAQPLTIGAINSYFTGHMIRDNT